jgi:hypothetical protein
VWCGAMLRLWLLLWVCLLVLQPRSLPHEACCCLHPLTELKMCAHWCKVVFVLPLHVLFHIVFDFALALHTVLLALSRLLMFCISPLIFDHLQGASQHSSTPEEAFMACAPGDLTPTKHMSRKCALGWSPLTHHLFGVRGRLSINLTFWQALQHIFTSAQMFYLRKHLRCHRSQVRGAVLQMLEFETCARRAAFGGCCRSIFWR